MSKRVQFENIEAMRYQAGIEDVELREAIRTLQVGDSVYITPVTDGRSSPGRTLLVRITRIDSDGFHAKLAGRAPTPPQRGLRIGSAVAFTASHIHSIVIRATNPRSSGRTSKLNPQRTNRR